MTKIPATALVILAVLSVSASAEQLRFNRGEPRDEIEARNRDLRELREARRAAVEAGRREAEARQLAEQAHERFQNENRLRRNAEAKVEAAEAEAATVRSSAETEVATAEASAEADVQRARRSAAVFAIVWAGLMALVVRAVTANAREEARRANAATADERYRTRKAVAAAKEKTRTEASKARKAATAELRVKLKAAEREATVARTAERMLKDQNEELKKRVLELEMRPGHHSRTEVVAHMLGLATPVTRPAIKAARRQVAKTFHPDVCRGPLATRIMQFLNPELDSLERNL